MIQLWQRSSQYREVPEFHPEHHRTLRTTIAKVTKNCMCREVFESGNTNFTFLLKYFPQRAWKVKSKRNRKNAFGLEPGMERVNAN